MPGRARPSRNSRDAPPPVERWSNGVGEPGLRLTAASESPPPTTREASAPREAVARRRGCRRRTARARTRPSGRSTGSSAPSAMTSAKAATVSGPMSSPMRPSRDVGRRNDRAVAADARSSAAATTSAGSSMATPLRARKVERRAHFVEPIRLDEAGPDPPPVGREQRERHRAADQQRVHAVEQRLDDGELVATPLRRRGSPRTGEPASCEQPVEHRDLPLRSGAPPRRAGRSRASGRAAPGHARVGAVRCPEGVIDIGVGEIGEPPRESRRRSASSPGSNRRFSSRTTVVGRAALMASRRPSATPGGRAASARRRRPVRDAVRHDLPPLGGRGATRGRARRRAPAAPERRQRRADPAVVGDRRRRASGTLKSMRTKTRCAGDVAEGLEGAQRHGLTAWSPRPARRGRPAGSSIPTRCRTSRRP